MSPASDHDVVQRLRELQLAGDFTKIKDYIASLDEESKKDLFFIICLANHYADIGHFAAAAKWLDLSEYHNLILMDDALLDEQVAVLALINAYVSMYRDHKWEEALALTNRIDEIYVHGKGGRKESI